MISLLLIVRVDRYLVFEDFLERYKSLGACEAKGLNLILQYVQQVVVVAGIEFDKDIILAR